MIFISFSGIKILWLLGGEAPKTTSPIINFLNFYAPFFTTTATKKMKRYAYAEMPAVRLFCGNAHRHLSYASTGKRI